MTATLERRADRAWIILASLTVASMAAAHFGVAGLVASGVVLSLATIKARYVLWDFLDIRLASSGWRVIFLTWLLLIAATAWTASAASLLFSTSATKHADVVPAQRKIEPRR